MELATIKETSNPYEIVLKSKKLSELVKADAVPPIVDVISNVYFELGQNVPGNDKISQGKNLTLLATSVWREIQQEFSFLRQEEVKLAFHNGARGEYGEFFGINLITFHKWLKGYQLDAKRAEARRKVEEAGKVVYAPVMSESEAEYEWKLTIQRQFKKFKQTGILVCAFPSHVYSEFKKRGLISLPEEEMKAIYEQAKNACIEHARLERVTVDKIKRQELNGFLERAVKGEFTKQEESRVKTQARKIAIENYYKNINELKL